VSKALILWDDTNMEKDTLPLTTFVSPRTGVEYLVIAKPQTRADYHEMGNPATRYIREYTQYDIVLNGNPVQFCFREEDIAETVEWFENPGVNVGSRFD
jgi:hypothetical protein